MIIYCTSKNTGPSWLTPDPITMVYLGTSLEDAEKVVDMFKKYETGKDSNLFPRVAEKLYSALPQDIDWEMLKFYSADGWWFSIVSFELEDSESQPQVTCKVNPRPHVKNENCVEPRSFRQKFNSVRTIKDLPTGYQFVELEDEEVNYNNKRLYEMDQHD